MQILSVSALQSPNGDIYMVSQFESPRPSAIYLTKLEQDQVRGISRDCSWRVCSRGTAKTAVRVVMESAASMFLNVSLLKCLFLISSIVAADVCWWLGQKAHSILLR